MVTVQPGAGDLVVIGSDNVNGSKKQRGARIGNGVPDPRDVIGLVAADAVAADRNLPQRRRWVDGGVLDVARVLGGVDVAKVVGAGLALFQVGREDGFDELVLDVLEKRLLLVWADRVGGAKGGAEEAGREGVVADIVGDVDGRLDGLRGEEGVSDLHAVCVDDAAGAGAVAVLDDPGFSREAFGCGGVVWLIQRLALDLGRICVC